MLPIIDTHQHLWDLDRFHLPWVAGVEALNRSFRPDDYAAATAGLGVVRSVYMEVDLAADQRRREVEYVGALCADPGNPMAGAVVAGTAADPGFGDWVHFLRSQPHVKGVRQVLHVPSAPRGTCLGEAFVTGVRLLGEAGLRFDLCLRPAELADAADLADRCPDTLLVLDHCGNADPRVVAGAAEPEPGPFAHTAEQWRRDMGTLGERANLVCKISGIAARGAEATSADGLAELLAPTVDHCLDAFGPDRVVFGGDWPVCLLGASYRQWVEALRQIVAARPVGEQRRLLHDNAARLYAL